MEPFKSRSNIWVNSWFAFICIALSCLTAAAVLFVAPKGNKWLYAFTLGAIAFFGSFIIQKSLKSVLLFLVVFLIPLRIDFFLFYKDSFFTPSGYPGFPVTAFDIVLFMLVCQYFFEFLKGKEKIHLFPAISVPALLYLTLSGISAFKSVDMVTSFANFFAILKSYIVLLYFANRIKTKKELSIVVLALAATVLIQSFVGVLQYLTGGSFLRGVFGVPVTVFHEQAAGIYTLSRVGGTIGHPNALARYIAFCIPVIWCYALYGYSAYIRKLAFFAVLGGGLTMIITLSRGSWIALGTAAVFLFYKIFNRFFKSRPKAAATVILVCFIFAMAVVGLFENVRHRLFDDDYVAAKSRITMAQIALNIIKEYPLSGIGLNNYTRVMQNYDRTRNWQSYGFPHPVHNSYLLIAAESGIPALMMFLWLLAAAFKKALSGIKQSASNMEMIKLSWAAGLLTWLIAALFDRDFAGTNTMLWFTMGMILSVHSILERMERHDLPAEKTADIDRAYHDSTAQFGFVRGARREK